MPELADKEEPQNAAVVAGEQLPHSDWGVDFVILPVEFVNKGGELGLAGEDCDKLAE